MKIAAYKTATLSVFLIVLSVFQLKARELPKQKAAFVGIKAVTISGSNLDLTLVKSCSDTIIVEGIVIPGNLSVRCVQKGTQLLIWSQQNGPLFPWHSTGSIMVYIPQDVLVCFSKYGKLTNNLIAHTENSVSGK